MTKVPAKDPPTIKYLTMSSFSLCISLEISGTTTLATVSSSSTSFFLTGGRGLVDCLANLENGEAPAKLNA